MRSFFVAILAALFMVFLQPAAGQDELNPSSQLLLDELGDELAEKADAYDRYKAYWERDVTLAEIAADDPLFAMLAPILRLEVGAGVAGEFGENAIETLAYDEPENLEWAIDDLLASAYYNSSASPPTRKDLSCPFSRGWAIVFIRVFRARIFGLCTAGRGGFKTTVDQTLMRGFSTAGPGFVSGLPLSQ